MRARARLARRSSWRSKMRSTASETFRYSPSSTDANSQKGAPTRGMIEVPPPVRISKPLTSWPSISRMRGTKPRSWMFGDRAVLVGGGEGDLELARQQLADLVAHEVAHERADVGSGVEQLALARRRPTGRR